MSAARPLSNPQRRLWPEFTKADLADYYEAVADRLLPAIAGRPVTFRRHPRGVEEQGFFQKDLPDHAPEHLGRFTDWSESAGRELTYAVLSSVDDLHWCAQNAVVELHPWTARTDRPDRPDTVVFDLDPGERDVAIAVAAGWMCQTLSELDLATLVKTSGKAGLHVLVPIERRYSFEQVRGFALAVARVCAARHPDDLTVEMRKARRKGRLLLDWSRNGRAQTIVAAWSPRAVPEATVAMPLAPSEVDEALDPGAFTLATAADRADPWVDGPRPQRLEHATRALEAVGYAPVDFSPRSSRSVEERAAASGSTSEATDSA